MAKAGKLIVFKGLNKYLETLKDKIKDIEKVDRVVEKAARRIEREAKRLAPVKTGNLRGSIHSAKIKKGVWFVADGVDYGIYQELGTRRGVKARFFLTSAFKKNKKKLITDLKALIE